MGAQFFATLIGAGLLAFSLGLPYMKVMEKLGWSDSEIILGMVTLVSGIVILAMIPYLGM